MKAELLLRLWLLGEQLVVTPLSFNELAALHSPAVSIGLITGFKWRDSEVKREILALPSPVSFTGRSQALC